MIYQLNGVLCHFKMDKANLYVLMKKDLQDVLLIFFKSKMILQICFLLLLQLLSPTIATKNSWQVKKTTTKETRRTKNWSQNAQGSQSLKNDL